MKVDLTFFYCQTCEKFASCDCLINNSDVNNYGIKLADHLKSHGYFTICNFNKIDKNLDINLSSLYSESYSFFNLPYEEKIKCLSKDKARRGYSPLNEENFATLIGVSNKPNDTVEKYRIGPVISEEEKEKDKEYYEKKEARVHFFSNSYNRDVLSENFINTIEKYYQCMTNLSYLLLNLIEFVLKLDRNFLKVNTDKHTSILGLNYFPHISLDNSSPFIERIAEHTDVSMFTLLAQLSSTAGTNSQIEMYDRNNQSWEAIELDPSVILVNLGDCLRSRSRGLLSSALHRVIALKDPTPTSENLSTPSILDDRYTAAFFFTPNYDSEMTWPEELLPNSSTLLPPPPKDYDSWRKLTIKQAVQKLKLGTTIGPTSGGGKKKKDEKNDKK